MTDVPCIRSRYLFQENSDSRSNQSEFRILRNEANRKYSHSNIIKRRHFKNSFKERSGRPLSGTHVSKQLQAASKQRQGQISPH